MTGSHIPPESLTSARSPRWLWVGTGAGLAVIAGLIFVSDGERLLQIAAGVDFPKLLWPLACTAGSYAAMARSYQKIAAAAGLEMRFGEMTRITLVSTAANYVVSTAGLSGLAVRSYYFFRRHRLGWGNAVSISLAQTFLTNLVLFAVLAWGILNLLLYDERSTYSLAVVAGLFVVALSLCAGAVLVVASRGVRIRLFGAAVATASTLARLVSRRPSSIRTKLALFEEEFHEGVDFLIARGSRMAAPLVYIVLDWLLMLGTLYAAFVCVERVPPLHVVIIGFSAGVLLSVVNLVPGGLGIMEGSMAAVFSRLGVPLETALVAALIFRISYYVVPLLVTLLLFPEMLRQSGVAPVPDPGMSRGPN